VTDGKKFRLVERGLYGIENMMGEEILAALLAGVAEGVAVKLASKGMEGLEGWLTEIVAAKSPDLSDNQKSQIARFLRRDQSFLGKLMAQGRFPDRKGILVVGPSGSGKSALIRGLSEEMLAPSQVSTGGIEKNFMVLGGRYVAIRDSRGINLQGHLDTGDTYNAVRRYRPRILILNLANGFLQTVGAPPLMRPQDGVRHRKLNTYRAQKAFDQPKHPVERQSRDVAVQNLAIEAKVPVCAGHQQALWARSGVLRV